ncbi:MAG: hypothetical protein ACM3NQ_19160 [Bacteroidales bacterium]
MDGRRVNRVGSQIRERFVQPWGTWAWSTHRPAGGTLPAIITYHKDGTLTGSDGIMFGIDYPPALNTSRESLIHGVWERTGPLSFRGTSLYMQFAPNGNVIAWGRSRSDLHFVGDADHFEGTMWLDSLQCPTPFTCPDPTTGAWIAGASRAVSGVRLHRVEPPGF